MAPIPTTSVTQITEGVNISIATIEHPLPPLSSIFSSPPSLVSTHVHDSSTIVLTDEAPTTGPEVAPFQTPQLIDAYVHEGNLERTNINPSDGADKSSGSSDDGTPAMEEEYNMVLMTGGKDLDDAAAVPKTEAEVNAPRAESNDAEIVDETITSHEANEVEVIDDAIRSDAKAHDEDLPIAPAVDAGNEENDDEDDDNEDDNDSPTLPDAVKDVDDNDDKDDNDDDFIIQNH
ncbi:coiled-coil domain-containing protein 1-like [Cynara cardunculus var. scolymus]|uniref:coiled-coil domain-containing protein 1-like n=1 Tax=Cynara cardunculus var. scolymus TaxID=59895 RepID=UPI000D626E67|nr:coiled-coil domain-containing protein 1-like [Cynara cardunculus var. scolymus]